MRQTALRAVFLTASLAFAAGPGLAQEPDLANGEKVFRKCKACHALEAGKNRVGPSLNGLVGSTAGSVEGYKYSQAMIDSGVVWDDENLDKYLTKPKEFIPKNKMAFPGLKDEQDRIDLIAYLKEATQ